MFDKAKADHAVNFINCLKHTKGRWRGVPFELLPWQDEIIRTLYGTVKETDTGSTIPVTVRYQRKTENRSWRLPLHCI